MTPWLADACAAAHRDAAATLPLVRYRRHLCGRELRWLLKRARAGVAVLQAACCRAIGLAATIAARLATTVLHAIRNCLTGWKIINMPFVRTPACCGSTLAQCYRAITAYRVLMRTELPNYRAYYRPVFLLLPQREQHAHAFSACDVTTDA